VASGAVLIVAALVAVGLLISRQHGGTPTASGTPVTPSSSSAAPSSGGAAATRTAPSTGAQRDLNAPPPSLAPVRLNAPAAEGNGITARVIGTQAIQGSATGPGNVDGPALRVTLRITNGTARPVSLDGVAVNLAYGPALTPASPLDDRSQAPFHGTVAPGGSADGVYVFTIAVRDRDAITLTVGYQAGAPILVFTGSAR
jgi:hypothetical protein